MPITPGDQIRVEVFGNPDLTTSVPVAGDGSIRLPLVGTVSVSGRTPTEAAQKVEAALKAGQFLVDPHATVTVVQSFRQRVDRAGRSEKSRSLFRRNQCHGA